MLTAEEKLLVAEACIVAGEPDLYTMFDAMGFTSGETVFAILALRKGVDRD